MLTDFDRGGMPRNMPTCKAQRHEPKVHFFELFRLYCAENRRFWLDCRVAFGREFLASICSDVRAVWSFWFKRAFKRVFDASRLSYVERGDVFRLVSYDTFIVLTS